MPRCNCDPCNEEEGKIHTARQFFALAGLAMVPVPSPPSLPAANIINTSLFLHLLVWLGLCTQLPRTTLFYLKTFVNHNTQFWSFTQLNET